MVINRTVIFHSGRAPGRPPRVYEGCGPPVGRRPARPLTRKFSFTVGLMYCLLPTSVCFSLSAHAAGVPSFSKRLMPAGHLLFCTTKKGDKKVAGNAIPRSRLSSERKTAHSRSSSLYSYFDTSVKSRECFLNLRLFRTGTGGNQPQLRLHVGPGGREKA